MKKIIVSSLVVASLFVGCGQPEPEQTQAASHQATFVESQSSAEVMIKATGEGSNMERALRDSELAALWFVLNGGDNPILQSAAERNKFEMYASDINKNSKKYISKMGKIKGKRIEGKTTYVDRIFILNTAMLKEDLVAKGIIKSVDELSDSLGTITVAVLPKEESLWSDTEYQAAVDVVSEYLQDRNFEVTVLKAAKKSNKIVQKAAMLSGVVDPMYALAMESGSDIYISINLDKSSRTVAGKQVKKASVSMSAYYTATAKQLGASSGYSPERAVSGYMSVTQEATNDAVEKVLGQIQKSWKKEAKRGKYYKVIVTAADGMGKKIDRPMYETLKSTCKRVKRLGASDSVFNYTLQCTKIEDTMQLLSSIEDSYTGAGKVFRTMDSGSLLIVKVAESEDDELIIE